MRGHITSKLLLGAWLLSGCAVGPDYRAPEPEVPARWHQPAEDGLVAGDADVSEWWRLFQDDMLTDLIERAMKGNYDLRLATLRIREARATRSIAAGELLPSLTGQGSYRRSQASGQGLLAGGVKPPGKGAQFAGTVARGTASSILSQSLESAVPGAPGVTYSVANGLLGLIPSKTERLEPEAMDLFTTGFDASWEIDVFGGIRRNVESADAYLAAAVEDCRGVQVSLLAEVAATYIDIRALQAQIEVTRENIELQKETVSLTRARFVAELASELDVRQAEANLAATESELPLLEAGLAIAIYRMGILIGQEPAALYDELVIPRSIPQPPEETLVGVPTDILRRRPDIRAAERRLAAETARIGVAMSELYPRFTLSGTFGFEATDADRVWDARSITYGFGPSVRWNIFDGLRNLNRIASQEAVTHQSYVIYQRTLLTALQEVESSLVTYKREQTRRAALARAVEAADRSVKLAEELYRNGLVDFQNVLDAQRSLATLENQLAYSTGQIAINLVALYKALGGGWSSEAVPQREYLEDDSDATHRPIEMFFSGGKDPLPWECVSEDAETAP